MNNEKIIKLPKQVEAITEQLETITKLVPTDNNDLINLQNAINSLKSNETLTLQQGKIYSVSGTLNLKSDCVIDGNGATIIQLNKNTSTLSGINVSNVTIKNLNIIGEGEDFVESDNRLAIGIYFKGTTNTVSNIYITKCTITNCTFAGIYFDNAKNLKIINNKVTGTGSKHLIIGTNYQFGITTRVNCENVDISNNEISNVAQGIYGSHTQKNTTIANNYIHDIIGQHGMYLANGTDMKISGNTIVDVAYMGIKIQLDSNNKINSKNTIINDNIINNIGIYGITLENVDVTTVVENRAYFQNVTIKGNILNGGGISIRQCEQVKCYKNTVDGSNKETYGVFIFNSKNVDVNGNSIKNVGWSGIYITSGTGILNPCEKVTLSKNVICEFDQSGSTNHAGIYSLGQCLELTIDNNYLSDKNNLAYLCMFLVDNITTSGARIVNNTFLNKSIRFGNSVTKVNEYNNNITVGILGFPTNSLFVGNKCTIYTANAIPTSGIFSRGDRVINSSPTIGQPKSWICTVSGESGTWVSEGNL